MTSLCTFNRHTPTFIRGTVAALGCLAAAVLVSTSATASASAMEPRQSPRLERAKDLIADEQWLRAIEQLSAAAADPKERNKDEALFWLAHSQHQASDDAAAVQTVSKLEQQFPTSRWVKPARSLRIEIAQKLQRLDVLWWTVQPPATPVPGKAPAAASTSPRGSRTGRAIPAPPVEPATVVTPGETPRPAPAPGRRGSVTVTPAPSVWIPAGWDPDTNLRIQALGSLIQTDAPRVIPILKEIALESPDPSEAGRAIFVLAQSGRPDAQTTVLEVAKAGSELVQVAAVRELGRFGNAKLATELLQMYKTATPRVKYQVVNTLGECAATMPLMRIAEFESDKKLQETAIVRLGQAGGKEQLQRFYVRAKADLKRPIIIGLFNARAEDELIRIAEEEKDPAVTREVLTRLRLLGTPKARAYLEKRAQNR